MASVSQRGIRLVAVVALGSGVMVGLGTSAAEPPAGPGCDSTKLVVAHDGAGKVRGEVARKPVVCAVQTGFQTSETRIAIGNDGTVVQFPAVLPQEPAVATTGQATSGFAVSANQGKSWSVHQVMLPATGTPHPQWTSQDVNFFIDRATGRIFASAPELTDVEPNLAYSDDNGRTWITSRPLLGYSVENPNFIFAKPRVSKPSAYPNVVYYCENITTFGTSARVCTKSLDGGNSWVTIGQGFTGGAVVPEHPECGSDREEFSPGPEGYPVAAPDGSLYLLVSCGGKHFIARSDDEAATWPIVKDAKGQPLAVRYLAGRPAPNLRSDLTGNLYIVSAVGSKLLVAASRDYGRTWTRELNMVPPGVTGVNKWYMQSGKPGQVAVSFYAARKEGTDLDAWLSETRDAFAARPVFFSGRLNDPKTPVLWGGRGNAPWPLLDFIGVDIGPDGTVWGSFIQDCGPNLGDGIACQGRPTYNNVGFVGRLAWSSAAATRPSVTSGPPAAPTTPAAAAPGRLPATGLPLGIALLGCVLLSVSLVLRTWRRRTS
jgi:hypothetical protein